MFRECHKKHNCAREILKLGALHCRCCVRGETASANYDTEKELRLASTQQQLEGTQAASCRSSGNAAQVTESRPQAKERECPVLSEIL